MAYKPGGILLNKYRLEELLGTGAFGEVYQATHIKLNAPRALKVLHRDTPGFGERDFQEARDRFQLEARLGAMLDHPNLVRVYDFEQEGDLLVLAMEYCPGGSLAERLGRLQAREATMPVEDVLRIAGGIASGLGALHAKDIVHRDLHPGNILFDAGGQAKISDLGLAQVPGGPSLRSKLSSGAGFHPGHPDYQSPEQATSQASLKPPSDVSALGCLIFEMLIGRVYSRQKPGSRPAMLRPEAPNWLDQITVQFLDPDPLKRPWDGQAARQALECRAGLAAVPPDGTGRWSAAGVGDRAWFCDHSFAASKLAKPAADQYTGPDPAGAGCAVEHARQYANEGDIHANTTTSNPDPQDISDCSGCLALAYCYSCPCS